MRRQALDGFVIHEGAQCPSGSDCRRWLCQRDEMVTHSWHACRSSEGLRSNIPARFGMAQVVAFAECANRLLLLTRTKTVRESWKRLKEERLFGLPPRNDCSDWWVSCLGSSLHRP